DRLVAHRLRPRCPVRSEPTRARPGCPRQASPLILLSDLSQNRKGPASSKRQAPFHLPFWKMHGVIRAGISHYRVGVMRPPFRPGGCRVDLGHCLVVLLIPSLVLAYFLVPRLWRRYEKRHPALANAPRVTHTASGIPGNPLNVELAPVSRRCG